MATRLQNRRRPKNTITTSTSQLSQQIHQRRIQFMSTRKTPLAGPQEPQTRTRNPARNAGTTINIHTSNPGKRRQPETETEQPENTAKPNPAPQPDPTPKPPIYDKPQRFPHNNGPRENLYATPLAATLFARFDPDDPNEQPAEHAIFIDHRLRQRGYI